ANSPKLDMPSEASLVERYVACFEKLGELIANENSDVASKQLAIGDPDQWGERQWRPVLANSKVSSLEKIYSELPGRFPPLFERLVLSYRWAEVDLQLYTLIANPPGRGLRALLREMSSDSFMWQCLVEAGYIRFGKGPDYDYDPVCFDLNSRKKNNDCKIVKIDHEEILCNDRV